MWTGRSSWKGSNNDIIGKLALNSYVGQCYSQLTSNVNRSQQLEGFKQRYNRKISTSFLCGPVLLSGNVQTCRSSWKGSNKDIIGNFALHSSVGQCYSQVTSNLHRSQQLEGLKQGYNRKLSTLFLCWPVLLSDNVKSEQVAAAGRDQTTI